MCTAKVGCKAPVYYVQYVVLLRNEVLLQDLGAAIRKARDARGLTQQQLAIAAGLSRNTLNRLENGVFPDLGIKKAQAILTELNMELAIKPARRGAQKLKFASMASASVNVSFRKELTSEELVHALLSGKATPGKAAHFIVLLEESPSVILKGLLHEVGALGKPGKIEKNLKKIAKQVGLDEDGAWLKKIA